MRKHLLLYVLICSIFLAVCFAEPIRIYVFGTASCHACSDFKKKIAKLVGEDSIVFYDIYESKVCLKAYRTIYEILFPNSSLKPIPLSGVFIGGKLKMVIVGSYDLNYLKSLLKNVPSKGVLIVHEGQRIVDESKVRKVEEIFKNPHVVLENRSQSYRPVLPVIIACALVDSINPCTFAVFTALLLIVFHVAGRRRMLLAGFSFIAAVCIIYLFIGLNLAKIIGQYEAVKYFIGGFALAVGLYSLVKTVKGKHYSVLPKSIRDKISCFIEKSASIPLAFALGAMVSISLLPCSAGPYLIALYYIGKYSLSEALPLLLLYNAIFVAPLLAITVISSILARKLSVLKEKRSKLIKVFNIAENILLIILALFLLLM